MKRKIAMFLVMMLAATAFTGCGNSSGNTTGDSEENTAGENENIVIWAFTEPHAQYFEWVTEEYKKEHPDVDFTIEVMDIDAMDDKLAVLNASGGEEAPDLVDQEQGHFPKRMSEEQMCYYPLDEFIERDNVTEQMAKNRLNLYSWDGHYYGLEHALCPVTMAYRQDLFEEYNIEVPTTWEEYKAAAAKFAEHDIYIGAMKDLAIGGDDSEMAILLRAAGADYVDENGELNITEEYKNLVTDFVEMQKNGQLYPYETTEESWTIFAEDRVATYFTADWAAGWLRDNVPEQSGKWKMAELPKLTDNAAPISVSGGTGLCMTKYTKHDKEQLWDFMKFAQLDKENCVKKYEMISLYPVVYDAMSECNTPVEYYGNQNLGELYENLADEIPVQYQADWRNVFIETFGTNAYDLVEGNINIDEMCNLLTEAVEEYEASK